jgi:hypothetical protein
MDQHIFGHSVVSLSFNGDFAWSFGARAKRCYSRKGEEICVHGLSPDAVLDLSPIKAAVLTVKREPSQASVSWIHFPVQADPDTLTLAVSAEKFITVGLNAQLQPL